jgi:hypothetical protein
MFATWSQKSTCFMDEQLNKKDFVSFLPTMGRGRVGTWQEGSI